MFVDDDLFCKIHTLLSQVMATSIDALFIVFGYDKYLARAISLDVDNKFQTECYFHEIQLVCIINTRTMFDQLTNEKGINIQK